MEDLSFDQFADFVREWRRLSRKRKIEPESEFEADLGITGDDGIDLLSATERRFDIRLCSEEHGFRETFNLGSNEFLFHSEGFGPDVPTLVGRPSPMITAFNVGELYRAVQEAMREKARESM
jgi:acyl carrier protein